jgi:Zn-dependent protease with chaperone function
MWFPIPKASGQSHATIINPIIVCGGHDWPQKGSRQQKTTLWVIAGVYSALVTAVNRPVSRKDELSAGARAVPLLS